MYSIFSILILSISLSMDTFSLSLSYATLGLSKYSKIFLSSLVGIFHFFMPIIALMISNCFIANINTFILKFIEGIIFLILGIEMIIGSNNKNKEINNYLNLFQYFLFSLSVSLDSFIVGFGLKNIISNYLISSSIFLLVSFLFTYLGLIIGDRVSKQLGKKSTILGGIILIIYGLVYIFNLNIN